MHDTRRNNTPKSTTERKDIEQDLDAKTPPAEQLPKDTPPEDRDDQK